jgi:hypothetical protein
MISYSEEVAESEDFRDWRANAPLLYGMQGINRSSLPSITR